MLALLWDKGFSVRLPSHQAQNTPSDAEGCTWTRDTEGGREMITEYKRKADDTKRIAFAWNGPLPNTGLPDFAYAVREWKRIEQFFGFPQRITWNVYKKEWFVTHIQPISSLTPAQFHRQRQLDTLLPSSPFLYEKTEITELAPHPTPLTFSILQHLYRENGPASAAYASLEFAYSAEQPFVLVGNDLFVDRDRELHALLPSLRCRWFSVARLAGLRRTWHNIAATRRLQPQMHEARMREQLDKLLASAARTLALPAAVAQLETVYPAILATDICAAKATTNVRRVLTGHPEEERPKGGMGSLLAADITGQHQSPPVPPKGLVGNTLELADMSPFYALPATTTANWELTRWWNTLTAERRTEIEPLLQSAQTWAMLREQARWLLVSAVHALRDAVLLQAEQADMDRSLVWYATLQDYVQKTLSPKKATALRTQRQAHDAFFVPPRLSNRPEPPRQPVPQGVSPGTATGRLVTLESLASAAGPILLHVGTPSPDISRHFSRIGGILAEHGSVLSHLAILARQRRLPMIVHQPIGTDIHPGDIVDMNGGTGEVRVLKR